jgi:ribosomal protein L7/L12
MVIEFNPGSAKLQVIKVIKVGLDTGLKEAKHMCVDGKIECTREQFAKIKPALELYGAGEFNIIES